MPDMMTRRMLLLVLACVVGGAFAQAADPNMGTWKLNEAKSKFSPGAAKNHTVVYAPDGDKVKVTVDGVDGAGNKTHRRVRTEKFDRQGIPGDPAEGSNGDIETYTRVDAHHAER